MRWSFLGVVILSLLWTGDLRAEGLLSLEEVIEEALIGEVCRIFAHHHTLGVVDTINSKVVYDADMIVNLEDKEITRGKFLTEGGREATASQQF